MYQPDLRRDVLALYSRLHVKDEPGAACMASGLGKFPSHVPSVANVLLFNSTENPYREYNTMDNLVGTVRAAEEEEEEGKLAAAPTSLVDGAMLVRLWCRAVALFFASEFDHLTMSLLLVALARRCNLFTTASPPSAAWSSRTAHK